MKTLNFSSMILSLFFMLGSTGIFAGSDGAPEKHNNSLVCSNCTSTEDITINKGAYNESMTLKEPFANFTVLMPLVPKEASFEEETESIDTLVLKVLKPFVPAQAGFNDEDTTTTIDVRNFAPKAPTTAGFEDVR